MPSPLLLIVLISLTSRTHPATADDCPSPHNDFTEAYLSYVGAPGTQLGRPWNDSDYYETNANIPQLPLLHGFVGTAGTYRFMGVLSQTMIMIGEPKHGLWRYQENGFVREYRKNAMVGISADVDPNNITDLTQANYNKIVNNYDNYIPEEGIKGYKYPDQEETQGCTPMLNFIDLTIYHPKYGNKYHAHPPIDLPIYYCLVSQYDYPYLFDIWKYVIAQNHANIIGELGIRAGLDIKENYRDVVRLYYFPDASIWANVGVGDNETDFPRTTLGEINGTAQTINYQRVDLSKTNYEFYIVDKIMYNQPTVNLILVMENGFGNYSHSYVRPEGHYWENLLHFNPNASFNFNTIEDNFPQVWIDGEVEPQRAKGLPVYGHAHPDRNEFGLGGGACPNMGGDMAYYPWGVTGGAFGTAYQEITTICDAILLDVKFWCNLAVETWADSSLNVGNSAFDAEQIDYVMDRNMYGFYTDPYLTSNNVTNPYASDLTGEGRIINPDSDKLDTLTIPLNFTRKGKIIPYVEVPDLPSGVGGPRSPAYDPPSGPRVN